MFIMNRCCVLFAYLTLFPHLPSGNENHYWTKWVGVCCKENCNRRVTPKNGIFCANFSFRRGHYVPCHSCFCAECYQPIGNKPFPIRELVDDEGIPLPEKETSRFLKARPGDMLVVPFQCDMCHFRNMLGRNPDDANSRDFEILEYIRRANLDAMWARESTTVKQNLRVLLRAETFCDRVGLNPVSPLLGPFPLEDSLGMQAAIAVLDKSLDKGKYEAMVQWETFRKTRSSITNYQASVYGLS